MTPAPPLAGAGAPPSPPVLLFASYHAYLDHSSGAALATRDLFEALTARGWACHVVCGPALDYEDGRGPADVLRAHQIPHHVERCAPPDGARYELFHFALNGVPVSQYRPETFTPHRPATRAEGAPFLDLVSRTCARVRPDVVLTYGGPPFAAPLMRRVRRTGARVVFCLHNFAYREPELLRAADALWVPSAFARAAYRARVGVDAEAVPWPWDRARTMADRADERFVTFVNPVPVKGVAWFARIAAEAFRRRPDIPFLVVEGRAGADGLRRLPVDRSALRNLSVMRSTPRPRAFYARARVVLVPSLWEETFGRVAAEALTNGIPVLATRRGALPETLGGAGLLFDVPDRYTDAARMSDVPTPAEAAPWVDAIERLWDDPAFYAGHCERARDRARVWEPERLCAGAEAFLRRAAAGRPAGASGPPEPRSVAAGPLAPEPEDRPARPESPSGGPSERPGAPPPDPTFDALIRLARARRREQHGDRPVPLTGDALIAAFDAALAHARAVSFDVFDTLVLRRVGHPGDVFLHLDAHPAFARHRLPRRASELRAEAEDRARRRLHEARGTGEVVLPEIYAAFCERAGLPAAAVDELVAAEEEVELLLCRPNPRLHALFRRAAAAGKPIVALSDTYHRRAFLVRLLAAVGTPVPADAVFASSEWRVNKQGGHLFDAALGNLRRTPAEVLHVGDHPVSDFRTPHARGVRAVLHGHHGHGYPPAAGAAPDAPLRSLLRAHAAYAARGHPEPGGFWWRLGHTTFGPLVVGFALWLRQQFRADRIDRAYFLLRDGEIFHRVFETLFPPGADGPVCRRLPASRRAFVFPLLDGAPDFVLPNLMVCAGPRPVGEFLDRLGVEAAAFGAELHACGFRDAAEPIDGRREGPRLLALFNRPRVHQALLDASRHERARLVGYLRQEGVLADGHVALIDLGWHGTIHKAAQLLGTALGGPRITGYYLATFPKFRAVTVAHLRARAYLSGPGEPGPLVRAVATAPQLLEIVCSSPTGSLLHFARSARGFDPVLRDNPAGADQLRALDEIHAGIVAFAREYRDTPARLRADEIPPALAAEDVLRLLTSPTKEEAARVGELAHGDDFGTDGVRYAARFRPTSDSPEAVWDDYQRAYWKPGLLNQPSPQGALLRTLWWLMQD